MNETRLLSVFFSLIACSTSLATSLETSFDFSRSVIGIDVSIKDRILYAILDTGIALRPSTR